VGSFWECFAKISNFHQLKHTKFLWQLLLQSYSPAIFGGDGTPESHFRPLHSCTED